MHHNRWIGAGGLKIALLLAAAMVALGLRWSPPGAAAQTPEQKAAAPKPGLKFLAGAYAMDITPQHWPVSVNGGFSDIQATKVTDKLHARCIVLDDGRSKLALAVVDSCVIPRSIMDAAKALAEKSTGIAADRMLISATHTHSAVTCTPCFQSDPDEKYIPFMIERIAKGIEQAHAQREPAEIGWAHDEDPTQVFNRRWFLKEGKMPENPFGRADDKVKMNPGHSPDLDRQAGPVDPQVWVLSVRTPGGRPIALLANYGLHYVGGIPANSVSADYFGRFAEKMKAKLGAMEADPPFVGIMSNGTSGDVNNVDFSKPGQPMKPMEKIDIVAESVSAAAMRAVAKIKHRPWVQLAAAQETLDLGVRKPTAEEVEDARRVMAAAKGPVMRSPREVYARETVKMAEYPDKVNLKIQALRIGELCIAAIPCEVFAEIGLEIKKLSPLRETFIMELANGYNGYLPTPKQHELGGYETWRARSSYLEKEASVKIMAIVMKLLNQVAAPIPN